MEPNDDVERVRRVYSQRERRLPASYYSLMRSGNLYRAQRLERGLIEALVKAGFDELAGASILDVGCGYGDMLRQFQRYGARPEHLVGVDVLSERLDRARDLSPQLRYELIDGVTLPFVDASFDLVMQFTVFSSIVEPQLQSRLAAEMVRVLKPGGCVVWYDMRVTNPRNRDLVPMTRARLEELFAGCRLDVRPYTLIPGIDRRFAPIGWGLCRVLEAVPLLRSHLLGVIRPDAPRGS